MKNHSIVSGRRRFELGYSTAAHAAVSSSWFDRRTGRWLGSEALKQQLGLKLEGARRRMPAFVVDHIEENPTKN